MDRFEIKNVSTPGAITFFDRWPDDPSLPIEGFWIKVEAPGLIATSPVSAYVYGTPAPILAEMADRWRGWDGVLSYEPIEGELILRCEQDRTGHVTIEVELHTEYHTNCWTIRASIGTEAGQLSRIAGQAIAFFGNETCPEVL